MLEVLQKAWHLPTIFEKTMHWAMTTIEGKKTCFLNKKWCGFLRRCFFEVNVWNKTTLCCMLCMLSNCTPPNPKPTHQFISRLFFNLTILPGISLNLLGEAPAFGCAARKADQLRRATPTSPVEGNDKMAAMAWLKRRGWNVTWKCYGYIHGYMIYDICFFP